ncbi:ATP-grasp domain-containing protein [Actinoplanes sp. KI2]|uniref:ATP-grasp domain-containing protein n=1 Tax=Actinoplanes sp. KI2 TaxID=2983315 RepID=UPI003983D9DF
MSTLAYDEVAAVQLPKLFQIDPAAALVVQRRRGSGGAGTFFADTKEQAVDISVRLGSESVLVSRRLRDTEVVNSLIGVAGQVAAAGPQTLQGVGIPACTNIPTAYCGSDVGAVGRLPAVVTNTVRDVSHAIAAALGRLGYQGLAGVDFLYDRDEEELYPIDLNPRFQASTRLASNAERAMGREFSFAELVLGHQAGILPATALLNWAPSAMNRSQLTVFNQQPHAVRLTSFAERAIEEDAVPLRLLGLPRRETVVMPGATLGMIEGSFSIGVKSHRWTQALDVVQALADAFEPALE